MVKFFTYIYRMWNTFFKMTFKECKRFCESRLRRLLVERPLAEKGTDKISLKTYAKHQMNVIKVMICKILLQLVRKLVHKKRVKVTSFV